MIYGGMATPMGYLLSLHESFRFRSTTRNLHTEPAFHPLRNLKFCGVLRQMLLAALAIASAVIVGITYNLFSGLLATKLSFGTVCRAKVYRVHSTKLDIRIQGHGRRRSHLQPFAECKYAMSYINDTLSNLDMLYGRGDVSFSYRCICHLWRQPNIQPWG